jgi:hypothetical protein
VFLNLLTLEPYLKFLLSVKNGLYNQNSGGHEILRKRNFAKFFQNIYFVFAKLIFYFMKFCIAKVMKFCGTKLRAGITHWKCGRAASLTNLGLNPAALPP